MARPSEKLLANISLFIHNWNNNILLIQVLIVHNSDYHTYFTRKGGSERK